MPASFGVCTTLESQYDIKQIQEYILPSVPPPLATDADIDGRRPQSELSLTTSEDHDTSHQMQNQGSARGTSHSKLIEVHVPTYPNSQFWIAYLIVPDLLDTSPPTSQPPASALEDDEIKYIYFKLVLPPGISDFPKGEVGDRRIISWGVGAKDGWRGKTMFGVFRGCQIQLGRSNVEKRGFWFSQDANQEGTFDIQIYRARGRKRISRDFPELVMTRKETTGVRLVNTGRLKSHHPQRFYQYALIDAVDEPYVTFRYHLRSMLTLNKLGIFPQLLADVMDSRFSSLVEHETQNEGEPQQAQDEADLAQDNTETEFQGEVHRLSLPATIRLVPRSTSEDPHSSATEISDMIADRSTLDFPHPSTSPVAGHHTTAEMLANAAKDLSIYDNINLAPRAGIDVARERAFRTPSPMDEAAEGSSDSTSSSSRRKIKGKYLKGVLESAFRRKNEDTSFSEINMSDVEEKYEAIRESL